MRPCYSTNGYGTKIEHIRAELRAYPKRTDSDIAAPQPGMTRAAQRLRGTR
jgi:hypothetical protein